MGKRGKRIRVGNTQLEISELMDQVVEQIRQGAGGEVLGAMEEFQRDLKTETERTWPVGKDRAASAGEPTRPATPGSKIKNPRDHSANLFELSTSVGSSGVEVSLYNSARWSWAVRFGREALSGQTKGKRAWTELVSKPGKAGSTELIDNMQDKILELADRAKRKG